MDSVVKLLGMVNSTEDFNAEKGADAIICLSGGKQTRVPKTLELWTEGYA